MVIIWNNKPLSFLPLPAISPGQCSPEEGQVSAVSGVRQTLRQRRASSCARPRGPRREDLRLRDLRLRLLLPLQADESHEDSYW